MTNAWLVLEDGTTYKGKALGEKKDTYGEVVFNTCMTGYQEVLTDPSYKGQMVVMTYPLIGNYGFNKDDNESAKAHVQGFIVKELCNLPSNWRNQGTPEGYLKKMGVSGITNIDTRHLTLHIRRNGSMYGIITTNEPDVAAVSSKAKMLAEENKNTDVVKAVSREDVLNIKGLGYKVAVLDYGVKENIIRSLKDHQCDIHILPADTTYKEIEKINPDGILLSNGPGDPENIPYAIETVKQLVGKYPIMGICLGHQLLGLALNGRTYKLKFGHHGGNHPVKDIKANRVYITSQNHNYALADAFTDDIEITHVNLNDGSVEGFLHKNLPILSYQYHPEACPGPEDSIDIFDRFIKLIKDYDMENNQIQNDGSKDDA